METLELEKNDILKSKKIISPFLVCYNYKTERYIK